MKNLLKVALVALGLVFMSNFAKAQGKIGHIAVDQITSLLPEAKTIQTQLQAEQTQWQNSLATLQKEFNDKAKEYEAKKATMTDAARTIKESELNDLQKRYGEMTTTAQTAIDNKISTLSQPLITKVRTAVSAVAKEKGYAYVINTSQTDLVVSPEADDLLAAVKVKLGLK